MHHKSQATYIRGDAGPLSSYASSSYLRLVSSSYLFPLQALHCCGKTLQYSNVGLNAIRTPIIYRFGKETVWFLIIPSKEGCLLHNTVLLGAELVAGSVVFS